MHRTLLHADLPFGPADQPATQAFIMRTFRGDTTLHLSEQPYDPGHGATVAINLDGIDALHDELAARDGAMGSRVWGPAVWGRPSRRCRWGCGS